MIRTLIAEDQTMIRGAFEALLSMEDDIEIIATAGDGLTAWRLVNELAPDVLIADIEMPELTGLELAARLKDHPTQVLMVTTFGRPGYLRRALEAGVRGYLLKDAPSHELAEAVRRVANGQRVFSDELMDSAWTEDDPLSDRERQILRLVEDGKSGPQIAKELGLSPGTARNYLHDASQKLGASNRVEAARIARAKGWL